MTTAVTTDLVTIDFDSETVNNNEFDEKIRQKNSIHIHNQEIDDLLPDVSFKGDNLEDSETNLIGESQPLLGADHHDHITYNQFPGTFPLSSELLAHAEQLGRNSVPHLERRSSYQAAIRAFLPR